MPRTRDIRPGFFKNEYLAELPALTRILFAGLWTLADKEGRLEDRPKRIKLDTLPFDDCDIDASLNELHNAGFIKRYQVGNQMLIQITKWAENQNTHPKEAPSILPPPELAETPSEREPCNYAASSGNSGANNAITSITSYTSIPSMPSLISTAVEKPDTAVSGSPTPKPTQNRPTRIPADWSPSSELIDWAKKERPDLDLRMEIDSFRDYWTARAGQNATKLDWDATFRNWIRKATGKSWGQTNPQASQRSATQLPVAKKHEHYGTYKL